MIKFYLNLCIKIQFEISFSFIFRQIVIINLKFKNKLINFLIKE